MATPALSRLFTPLKIGNMTLQHRIAMAPLTRYRSTENHIPIIPLMKEYYSQRASAPGTLLVTEATFIAPEAGGYYNVPGIWSEEQIAAWKQITDAVHAKGSYIYLQLWHLGRAAREEVATAEGYKVKSSSPVPIDEGYVVPEEMTVQEIGETVRKYAVAAGNAIRAGFDGVEVHGANGYLIDQFIQDNCNKRGDEYGGSVERRARFADEVVEAVVREVGEERVGVRLSPWTTFQGMRMRDPVPQFEEVLRRLARHKLAYVHFVRAVIEGNTTVEARKGDTLDFALRIWKGPVLIAGDLDAEGASKLVEEYGDRDVVAVFGRYFISNPDLVYRVREGIKLAEYDGSTFYLRKSPTGYVDQPFSREFEREFGVQQSNL